MRFKCQTCGGKTAVTHRNAITETLTEHYCSCPQCGHRFVVQTIYDRTITPPTSEKLAWLRSALEEIKTLPEEDRQTLLNFG